MPYSPTVWVNGQAPAINATNLNKLKTELASQAAVQSVANTLGSYTWANGTTPAVSDPTVLNEMERVCEAVAASFSPALTYTRTTWSTGWTPARNATRLNNLEVGAQNNRNAIDSVPPVIGNRLWASSSPINTLIPANPTVILSYGQGALSLIDQGSMGFNNWGYGCSLFTADATWPVISTFPQRPSDGWVINNVPFDATRINTFVNAIVSQTGDGEHHTVIDHPAGGRSYCLYGLNVSGGVWAFQAAGVLSTTGSGFWNNALGPWCGPASGFSSITGAVLRAELASGSIDHALGILMPKDLNLPTYVAPASSSDGVATGSNGFPMGTHFQLRPTLTNTDFANMGISSSYWPICKALQLYGGYSRDSNNIGSGRMVLIGQNWDNNGQTSWPAYNDVAMANLVPHMRTIGPPPTTVLDDRNTFGQPHM